jgi:hypothetical protein
MSSGRGSSILYKNSIIFETLDSVFLRLVRLFAANYSQVPLHQPLTTKIAHFQIKPNQG